MCHISCPLMCWWASGVTLSFSSIQRATVSSGGQSLCAVHAFVSFGCIPNSRIVGAYGCTILSFLTDM